MTCKLAIAGMAGRMGQAIKRVAEDVAQLEVCAATERDVSKLQEEVNNGSVAVAKNLSELVEYFDVLIDFTTPENTLNNLAVCLQNNKAIVIGTTGFSVEQRKKIEQAAKSIPIVFAANMSVGVNLCAQLVKLVSQILDSSFDIEILEAHHRNKKDAPSGTALMLGNAVASGLGKDLEGIKALDRTKDGLRERGSIGFSVVRAGSIVGEHTVMFVSDEESVEITHKAFSRDVFAKGAIKAAIWLQQANLKNGLYSMLDVLGLNNSVSY